MALVAYSDESDMSDMEDVNIVESIKPMKSLKPTSPKVNHFNDKMLSNTAALSGIDSIIDEDDLFDAHINETEKNNTNGLLSSLPAAQPINSGIPDIDLDVNNDIVDDVPTVNTWKITQQMIEEENSLKGDLKVKNKRIKFILPSLSEYEEGNEEKSERKCHKVSTETTGLFSLLPKPKICASTTKPNHLVPLIVKRPKPVKKRKTTELQSVHDSDDEDSSVSSNDFFSLTESKVIIPSAKTEINSPELRLEFAPKVNSEINKNSEKHSFKNNDRWNVESPQPVITNELSIISSSNYNFSNIDHQLNEEALVRLAGKRNKNEIINLVDINADDALMSKEEWMTRSLSEEKPTHSFSRKKEGMPSQVQKRKHQITFLAHQAKERELELKNTWSQNRLTKMQTQAKYGF